MKQIWTRRAGGPDVLEIREVPDPVPTPGEVLVRVRAAGVNFADVMSRMGMYPDAPAFPFVAGYEVAGTVVACGDGVSGFEPGDDVFGMTRFGGYSEAVSVPENQLFKVPAGLSVVDAAAIPVNYFTAYLALFTMGGMEEGERVLVHSAAGGVGTAAVELARTVNAEIYGTASASKHAYLRELGCRFPIDYRSTDFVSEVNRLTDGKGVGLVLDPIGGRNVARDRKILAPLGKIVCYGVASASRGTGRQSLRLVRTALSFPLFHPVALMNGNTGVLGLNLGRLWSEIPRLRRIGIRILELVAQGSVHPRARHEFPFDEVRQAHLFLQERKNTGKVVLIFE